MKRTKTNRPHVAVEVMTGEQRTGLAGVGDKARGLVVALPEVHGDVQQLLGLHLELHDLSLHQAVQRRCHNFYHLRGVIEREEGRKIGGGARKRCLVSSIIHHCFLNCEEILERQAAQPAGPDNETRLLAQNGKPKRERRKARRPHKARITWVGSLGPRQAPTRRHSNKTD